MAQVFGISGAWGSIASLLRLRQLDACHPSDLAPLLQDIRRRHQQGLGPLSQAFDQELEAIRVEVEQLRQQFPHNAAVQTRPLDTAISLIDRELSAHRSQSWLQRWTILLFSTLKLLCNKKRLLEQKAIAIHSLRADLAARQQKHDFQRQHRIETVAQRFQQLVDNVALLEQLMRSAELAGANAELKVIEELKALPGSYVVYNDLNLRAERPIRFQGEFLQTAQVDHLVVGPGGVFVLEVKRWSRAFVERGDYFDPYEQVARASYLCYDLLRWHIPGVRVRSVLVNCGVVPPKRNDLHVKVVTLSQLRGYVNWFREAALDSNQVAQVVGILTGNGPGSMRALRDRPFGGHRRGKPMRRRY